MARIRRSDDNLVPVPKNVSILKNGYVYLNVSTILKNSEKGGSYWDHDKELIGVLRDKMDKYKEGKRMMYANNNYYAVFQKENLPERPDKDDCVSVGLHTAIKEVARTSELTRILTEVFGTDSAAVVLDLAMYMICEESAVFQHFPHWCRDHSIFSESVMSDTAIGNFERETLSYSLIESFKEKWAHKTLDDGKVYLCYDSTNVNSQAEGVFLVQKGYAKDDPNLEQVNTDYVIRQRDGLPVTYTTYPGSINDMAEASEMTEFFKELIRKGNQNSKDQINPNMSVTMIADRGYISEENVIGLDQAAIHFLFMLRRNMGITDDLLTEYADQVKSSRYYIESEDKYGMTVIGKLFEEDTEKRYFHIIWDHTFEKKHRSEFYKNLNGKEKALQKAMNRKTHYSEKQLKSFRQYFDLSVKEDGYLTTSKRGRGNKGKTKKEKAYFITAAEKNYDRIDNDLKKCGFYILVTSEAMTTKEALNAYRKRDCVEKVFMALKSYLGMDKIGVHSDDSVIGKSFIWFIAAILHALIFNQTNPLRTETRKTFTMPAVIDLLEEIKCDRNLSTRKYKRRYKTTAKQDRIMDSLNVTLEAIDETISSL